MRLIAVCLILPLASCSAQATIAFPPTESPGQEMPERPGPVVTEAPALPADISVDPPTAVLAPAARLQLTAVARDAAGSIVSPAPAFRWTAEGGGDISESGLFVAGTAAGGPFTISATAGSVTGRATVTIREPPALPGPTTYRGTCDGSGAIALTPEYFLSVNDEDQQLRLYRRAEESAPLQAFDLGTAIGLGAKDEADFEEITRVGARAYIVSSHGRNSKGVYQPARSRFVAVDLAGAAPNLTPRVAGYSATLVVDMVDAANWVTPDAALITLLQNSTKLGTQTDPNLAPEIAGFSIEGMSSFPSPEQPGRLVIGLRNPRSAESAILVTLLNPDELATGAKAKFGEAFKLNLGGLGVRGMAWSSEKKALIVLAGPSGSIGPFQLYRWSGTGAPALIRTLTAPNDQNPESIVAYPGSADLQVVQDLGDNKIAGTPCKDAPAGQRFFTDQSVRLE